MGEAKRRKQQDPNYGKSKMSKPIDFIVTSDGILAVYSDKEPLTYNAYINPNFNLKEFNINQPHKVFDWQSYFFTTNHECATVDTLPINDVQKTNMHVGAFYVYLKKKIAKNLILDIETINMDNYLDARVKSFTMIKPDNPYCN